MSPAPSKETGTQWVPHRYFIKARGNKSRHDVSNGIGPSPKAPSLARLMERKESQGPEVTKNLRVSFSSERGGEWVTDACRRKDSYKSQAKGASRIDQESKGASGLLRTGKWTSGSK